MRDGLTLKQRKFAAEYIKTGNGTQAALKAGYANGKPENAAVQASENLRKPKVRRHIERIAKRWDISAERVLGRLDNLSAKAEEEGQLGAAIKAEELIGKSLGMWVERSLNVTVDLTDAHLEALRNLAAKGRGEANLIGSGRVLDHKASGAVGLAARTLNTASASMAGVSDAVDDSASTPHNLHYDKRPYGAGNE